MWELEDLEPITTRLLEDLVEAGRRVPPEDRDYFSFIPLMDRALIDGNGVRLEAREEHLDILSSRGLISVTKYHSDGHGFNFYVTPTGTKAYKELHGGVQESTENIENEQNSYLDASAFRASYPEAFGRWKAASESLWGAESETEFSTIGHQCREAMQTFISELIERQGITGADADVAKTVARFKSVLEAKRTQLGESKSAFLDALLAYWGTVIDLVQRQEHAGQKEGEPLVWEDARRVVFQTALVMFEIDRTI